MKYNVYGFDTTSTYRKPFDTLGKALDHFKELVSSSYNACEYTRVELREGKKLLMKFLTNGLS